PDTLAATVTMTGANLSFGVDVPNEEIAFFSAGMIATVDGNFIASRTVAVDDVTGIQPGMFVVGEGLPDGLTVNGVNAVTQEITVSEEIDVANGAFLRVFDPANTDKDNILSNARTIGSFDHPNVRTSNNSFEGWYVDDFIVGFAERGEEVVFHNQQGQNLNPAERNSDDSFWDIQTRNDGNEYLPQILEGEYQLEIRRGSFLTSRRDGN
ncbi:unnamed protein product, partial [marine sediment metagenome]